MEIMPSTAKPNTGRLGQFVTEMTRSVEAGGAEEATMVPRTQELLGELISVDDWLPGWCAEPDPNTYRQYLLHCDPRERFSVVSFVWGPGQETPVHDHQTWGVIGVLRGAECETAFDVSDGSATSGEQHHLEPGDMGVVSPTVGDVHQVVNAYDDRTSISIHVYGANIGRVERHTFNPESGAPKAFISSYNNDTVPNLWNT